mmetsp:Transcript_7024/g.10738  ORF Transcript_7024/g.10738 Transcript_7024/m.10738 type:complete len:130 (-) Transcript_7024:76-465(-)
MSNGLFVVVRGFFFSFDDYVNWSDFPFLEEAFLSSYDLLLEAFCDPLLQMVDSIGIIMFDRDVEFCDDISRVQLDYNLCLSLESLFFWRFNLKTDVLYVGAVGVNPASVLYIQLTWHLFLVTHNNIKIY